MRDITFRSFLAAASLALAAAPATAEDLERTRQAKCGKLMDTEDDGFLTPGETASHGKTEEKERGN